MVVPIVVLLAATFCLCMGYAVWGRVFVHVQGPAVAATASSSTPAGAASVPSYPAETVGFGVTGTHVTHFLQKADYVFNAFGGKLLGADRGIPGNVRWTTHGDLVFSVRYVSRDGLFRGEHTQCLLLDRSGSLRRQL